MSRVDQFLNHTKHEIDHIFHLRGTTGEISPPNVTEWKFLLNKTRRDMCILSDSIRQPANGKDCGISFPMETTACLIKAGE